MPRKEKTPKYCRQSGPQGDRAFVTLGGKRIYLQGPFNSLQSKQHYHRAIAEYHAQGKQPRPPKGGLLCIELCVRFFAHAKNYYRGPDGRTTTTLNNVRAALRPVRELYGAKLVGEFDLIALKSCRQTMIDKGWTRQTINRTTNMVKEMFRWGFEEGIVPKHVPETLRLLRNLQLGRTPAPENQRIHPVEDDRVEATRPFLTPVVRAMVDLQRLTGMRPGEVCSIRPVDINMNEEVWLYRPAAHKQSWRGRERVIFIGPKSQEILRPFLSDRPVDAYCFSPLESERHRKERISQVHRRLAQEPTPRKTARRINARFATGAYQKSIRTACLQAFPAPLEVKADPEALEKWIEDHCWTPNRLRHSSATQVRKAFGLDAAQLWLGHSDADITQVYAEVDRKRGVEIARMIG